MTTIKSATDVPLDEIDRLEFVLRKYLPTLKSKKHSMISLHLSDIAGEMPRFQKFYTALVQNEGLSEADFDDCIAELEVSVLHLYRHMKDLKPLLGKAVDAPP